MSGRRALVVLAALLAAGAVAVGLMQVGGDDAPSRPPIRPNPAEPPRGSLRVGVPELAATYNPFDARSRTPGGTHVLSAVLPQLFDVAPDGEVEGRLVEDGSVQEDGRTVRFRLARGARWSDGKPITAADVEFTWGVVRSEEWPGPDAGYDRIRSVGGGGRSVVVRFRDDVPGWERLFSGEDYVLPRHRLAGADLATVWAGGPDVAGGPYRLKGFTPGLDVVLSANPEWWGEGPGVKSVQLLAVPDATTLQQLYEDERLDVAWMGAFTERRRAMEAIEGSDVAVAEPGGRLVSVYVNTERVGTDVGLAVLDLVNRDRFVKVLFRDEAEVAVSWGMLPLAAEPGWPRWFVVPERAEDVGDRSLAFAVAEEEPMSQLVTRSAQELARGTDIAFDALRVDAELLDGEWLAGGDAHVALADEVQWPEPCWRCRFGSAYVGETNWSRVDDYDDLAEAADEGDVEAASRLERRLESEGVVLPMWRPRAVVVSRGVEGIEANSWAAGVLYRPERWRKVPV